MACMQVDYSNLGADGDSPFKEKLECIAEFWKNPTSGYRTWRKLAHYLFLFQPSVACVPFSFLRLILLRPGMDAALVDSIEGTRMEMYNSGMSDADALQELLEGGGD
jgi:hypothetical protein